MLKYSVHSSEFTKWKVGVGEESLAASDVDGTEASGQISYIAA